MVKQQYFFASDWFTTKKSTTESPKIKNYYNKNTYLWQLKSGRETILLCTDSYTTKIITYCNKTHKRSQQKIRIYIN